MATTIQPPKLGEQSRARRPFNQPDGPRNPVPLEGDLPRVRHASPPPSATGMWVVIASISMTFAAFTSALIVRQGGSNDWRHLTLPPILYLNTLVLIASSVALEKARRQIAVVMTNRETIAAPGSQWLNISLGLGLLFVVGQYIAWLQLRAQGLFLATNPNSSFFYVLTGVHALHVMGGLAGLTRVMAKLRNGTLRKRTLDATAHYWHFMGGLWIYLLILLRVKL